ncbi:MAG: hypothetical protein JNG88_15165 [Phycisphaerales bacterium]|nr:hypothetical protein [Phycisphaerales bacterium]
MAEMIKCACTSCGAKYRLPIESQGRSARCKQCGEKFSIPKTSSSLEDSIMSWLDDPEAAEELSTGPRVVSMPKEQVDSEAMKRLQGPIRKL